MKHSPPTLTPEARVFAQTIGMAIAESVWAEIAAEQNPLIEAGRVPAVETKTLDMRRAPGRQDREREANTGNNGNAIKTQPAA